MLEINDLLFNCQASRPASASAGRGAGVAIGGNLPAAQTGPSIVGLVNRVPRETGAEFA
jgi:hypothetical protein